MYSSRRSTGVLVHLQVVSCSNPTWKLVNQSLADPATRVAGARRHKMFAGFLAWAKFRFESPTEVLQVTGDLSPSGQK